MEQHVDIEDQSLQEGEASEKKKGKFLPYREPTEFIGEEVNTPSDEDQVRIAQAMMLELAAVSRASLDLSKASGVMALKDVIKSVGDIAQANIKNKQDADIGKGQIANGAALAASILRSINNPSQTPFSTNKPDPNYVPPSVNLEASDDISDQVMTRGVENLREEDFLRTKPAEDY